MVTNWIKTSEDLDVSVQEIVSRVNIVIDTVEEEIKNLEKITASTKSLKQEDDEIKVSMLVNVLIFMVPFQNLVDKSLSLYDSLRKERAAARQDLTPRQIAQTVVKMLKRRDQVVGECERHLATLVPAVRPVLDCDMAITLLQADIKQTSQNIIKTQLRRQNDIWCLLSVAVNHKPKSSDISQ